ncbi:MAG: hypothetical protein AAF810_17905 [Cyanobacteria bacterium P01_D01_bin.36]
MTKDNTDHREPNEANTAHINPGDKEVAPNASVEEKGEKTAVAYEDALGNPVEVPTYFEVEGENGEKEALHHVKDAEEISDVIRKARVNEEGDRTWR